MVADTSYGTKAPASRRKRKPDPNDVDANVCEVPSSGVIARSGLAFSAIAFPAVDGTGARADATTLRRQASRTGAHPPILRNSPQDDAADKPDTVDKVDAANKNVISPIVDKLTSLQPFFALANGIQKSADEGGWVVPKDAKGFADSDVGSGLLNGEWYVADVLAEIQSAQTLYSGLANRRDARRGYQQADEDEAQYDSLTGNLSGGQLEEGITGMLVNPFNVFNDAFNVGGVTDANPAKHAIDSVFSGKASIEDSVAAEKSRRQRHKAKHEADRMLPLRFRRRRLKNFAADFLGEQRPFTDANKPRTSDFNRFRSVAVDFIRTNGGDLPDTITDETTADGQAHALADYLLRKRQRLFLDYLTAWGIKEFGFGTTHRKDAEAEIYGTHNKGGQRYKATLKEKHKDYAQMRSLGKLASFAHRRKAETATTNAVGAAGSALVASGVGAKPGAALKVAKTGYTKLKTWGKRARRVHRLRTAKNEMGYDDRSDRGALWGAKQFFFGDVDKQYGTAKAAATGDESKKNKGASGTISDDKLHKLTKQCDRRIDDLLGALISDNVTIRFRAGEILHVIAETNLSGALNKISDKDLERYHRLYWQSQGKDPKAPHKRLRPRRTDDEREADHKEFDRRTNIIRQMVTRQLKGIGG